MATRGVRTPSDRAADVGRVIRRARRAVAAARAEDLFLHSAALAFYGLVSVAPLVVVIASYLGATTIGDSPGEKTAGLAVAFVFGFAATFVTVAFIYRVFPHTPLGWRPRIHGTLVAAASISMLSIAYVGASAPTSNAATPPTPSPLS